jgi:hypothetical protein
MRVELWKETPKGRRQKQPHQIKFKESRTTRSSPNNSPTTSHHIEQPMKRKQRESRRSKVNKTKVLNKEKTRDKITIIQKAKSKAFN